MGLPGVRRDNPDICLLRRGEPSCVHAVTGTIISFDERRQTKNITVMSVTTKIRPGAKYLQ
jgi:hypothetical protein